MARIRKAPRPFERFLPRLHLNHRVAGDQLLRLGEGPVDDGALASGIFDAPALRARLQAAGIKQHAGLDQLLVIVGHRGEEFLRRPGASFGVLGGFDQNHELHCRVSYRFGAWRPVAGIPGSTSRRTAPAGIDKPDNFFGKNAKKGSPLRGRAANPRIWPEAC